MAEGVKIWDQFVRLGDRGEAAGVMVTDDRDVERVGERADPEAFRLLLAGLDIGYEEFEAAMRAVTLTCLDTIGLGASPPATIMTTVGHAFICGVMYEQARREA